MICEAGTCEVRACKGVQRSCCSRTDGLGGVLQVVVDGSVQRARLLWREGDARQHRALHEPAAAHARPSAWSLHCACGW